MTQQDWIEEHALAISRLLDGRDANDCLSVLIGVVASVLQQSVHTEEDLRTVLGNIEEALYDSIMEQISTQRKLH